MERTETKPSSQIKSVGYDEAEKKLEVEFTMGKVYEYYNVPQVVYTGMLEAESPGKYFNQNVRGIFQYKQV